MDSLAGAVCQHDVVLCHQGGVRVLVSGSDELGNILPDEFKSLCRGVDAKALPDVLKHRLRAAYHIFVVDAQLHQCWVEKAGQNLPVVGKWALPVRLWVPDVALRERLEWVCFLPCPHVFLYLLGLLRD